MIEFRARLRRDEFTLDLDFTAPAEGVTVLFLAQLAGVDLTIGQQVLVAYMAILGGIGTAGVPSGSGVSSAMWFSAW